MESRWAIDDIEEAGVVELDGLTVMICDIPTSHLRPLKIETTQRATNLLSSRLSIW
jgi:hypothetical protein